MNEKEKKIIIEFENTLGDLITETLGEVPLTTLEEYYEDITMIKTIKEALEVSGEYKD